MPTITANTGAFAWNTNGAWVGGAQPSAADDVVLPASAVITLPAGTTGLGRSLTMQASSTLVWAATTSQLSLGDATPGTGNSAINISATATVTLTGVGTINLLSSSATQQTVTTGGKTLPNVIFIGPGSSYLLADAFASAGTFTHSHGTVNTGSNSISCTAITSNSVTNTRTLTLGSSAITCSLAGNVYNMRGGGLTVTANTAVLTSTGANASAAPLTTVSSVNGLSIVASGTGSFTWGSYSGLGSFTRTGGAGIGNFLTTSAGSFVITCSGTFTATGIDADLNRLAVVSPTIGTPLVITAAVVVLSNMDFKDVTGAGAGTWAGTSIGDLGGNSNITFTTPVTRYAVAAGNTGSTAMWSATSGGAAGASVPLAQDTATFNASSPAGTYTINNPHFAKDIVCTGFTRTLTASAAWETYGSLTLGSGMILTGTSNITFAGRGSHTITTSGKTLPMGIIVSAVTGAYAIVGTYTTSRAAAGAITLTSGTLSDGGNIVNMTSSGTYVQTGGTLNATGTWTMFLTNTATFWSVTGGVVNAGTATIIVGSASSNIRGFAGFGQNYGAITYTVPGSTGSLDMVGSNVFDTINFSDVTNARSLRFTAGTTTTVTNFNVVGTAGKLMTVTSITAANHTLLKAGAGGVSTDYLSISRSQATGPRSWFAGANSVDGGNNTGWNFIAPVLSTGTMLPAAA